MNPKEIHYENLAETMIKQLEKRNMKGYYCKNASDAATLALSLVQPNQTVAFGGSMTLNEIDLIDKLNSRSDIHLLNRNTAKTPQEAETIMFQSFQSDCYFMSTNAITTQGELINVDGNGNRVASLICGPKKVVVIAGINKVVPTVEDGLRRIHLLAAPANCVRLNCKTPCSKTGICLDCHSDDCICANTVITRHSRKKDRILVILVGEELGY